MQRSKFSDEQIPKIVREGEAGRKMRDLSDSHRPPRLAGQPAVPHRQWIMAAGMILICVGSVASGVWEIRRQVQKDVLPRKHRLEALLKELDAP